MNIKKLKKLFVIAVSVFSMFTCCQLHGEDKQEVQIAGKQLYTFTMSLHIPKIYNNTSSLGYRKYQTQKIVGQMQLCYDADGSLVDVQFYNLVNKTHKLSNGKNVTYKTVLDSVVYPRFTAIGNNKSGKFKTATVAFAIAAEPSYNIGLFDEDTSLYLTLAGKGTIGKNGLMTKATGYAAGTLGCGCKAYGHISPTRSLDWNGVSSEVVDVAAAYGTWKIKYDGHIRYSAITCK